jgi:acetyl-CoA synthetase
VADVEAKLVFTATALSRKGQFVQLKHTVDTAIANIASVQHVIVVKRSRDCDANVSQQWAPGKDLWWEDITFNQNDQFPTEIMDSEDPCMVLYSSGTTGKPKVSYCSLSFVCFRFSFFVTYDRVLCTVMVAV